MKLAHMSKLSHASAALLAAALIGGLLVNVGHAASVAITEATVFYEGSNQVVPDDLSNVDSNAVLVSFVAANVTYSDLVLVDSVTTTPQDSETYQFGINGTSPGSPEAAVTDNRLDSGIYAAKTTAEFEFASAPTSPSDLFFLFDLGGLDTGVSIQLIDSSDNHIGNSVLMANMAPLGSAVREASGGTHNINGVAIPLSDFGITAGQLSSVDGFKFTGAGVDPLIAGIAPKTELLLHESFEPASPGSFASGNKGDLTWALYGGAIVDTNLTHSGGTVLADGGDRALFVAGPAANNNAFAAFAFAQQTNDVYFSFLASTTSGVFFQPYVSNDADDDHSGSATLNTTSGDSVAARLRHTTNLTGDDIGDSQGLNAFIVGKLSKSAAGNYNTLEMLVNPTSLVEPDTWAANISRDILIAAVDTFGIRIWFFDTGEDAWIDEIRIGTTFAAVVPPAPKGTVVSIN